MVFNISVRFCIYDSATNFFFRRLFVLILITSMLYIYFNSAEINLLEIQCIYVIYY